jgi:ketosteroid isomerase-like protein
VLRADNTEKEEAVAEAEIRKRAEDWAKAIRAKEMDAVMSFTRRVFTFQTTKTFSVEAKLALGSRRSACSR